MLRTEGFEVAACRDGESALRHAAENPPDLVVLDLSLPGIDGVEVCRKLREFSDAYVIMLTSRVAELDRVIGFEVGADDYVTKPFSPKELVARIRAMMRRPRTPEQRRAEAPRRHGSLVLDPVGRTAQVDGQEAPLTRIEFDLLDVLTSEPTAVFTRSVLRERVWGPDWFGDDHVVDVHVANLRKKIDLGREQSYVRTVRGVGYRMEQSAYDGTDS